MVPGEVQHFPGGPTFSRGGGGGSNCLFPIETNITCDFPGGGGCRDFLSPPLDPHLGEGVTSYGNASLTLFSFPSL